MAIKIYRPTSAGRRNMSVSTFEELTKGASPSARCWRRCKQAGWAQQPGYRDDPPSGGGHKRRYRMIDFRRDKYGVPGPCRVD